MMAVSTGMIDITPPAGLPMGGYGVDTPRLATGTNEPLMARCTVLWDDLSPFVIVTADVLGFRHSAQTRIRTGVLALGIASSAFVLAATHTHNAPALDEGLDPFIAYDIVDLGATVMYTTDLVDTLIALVSTVLAAPPTPCTLDYVVLDEDFSVNREGLPNIERDVPVLVARDLDGQPRAVLFSYGAHPVAANLQTLFDPDYPAQAIKEIEAAFPLALAQFLLGPAGDQNPVAIGGFSVADGFGADLGETIVNAIEEPGRPLDGPIEALHTTVALPLDVTATPQNIAAVRAAYFARAMNPALLGFARRHAQRMVDLIDVSPLSLLESSIAVPVQRWRFAGDPDLTVIFSGGEVVSGYAAVLRAENGGSDGLWFVAYANETPAYIPSEELLDHACYAGGIDADFPGIAGGSMAVYNHLGHFRPASSPGAGDGVEGIYLGQLRAMI
jgi:hypothetical protein